MSGKEFIQISGCCNRVDTPTAIVRTHIQKRVGGYDPELPHTGDMEMWLRLAAHGNVAFIDDWQAAQRRHAANMQLQYMKGPDGGLGDFKQRQRAIQMFVSKSISDSREADQLKSTLLSQLAIEAVHAASAQFNICQMEAVRLLSEFALEADPRVSGTFPWLKLKIKTSAGISMWKRVAPLLSYGRSIKQKDDFDYGCGPFLVDLNGVWFSSK